MDEVLDHVSEGVLVVDDDWRVTRANEVATTLLSTADSTLAGADVRTAFPQSVESTFHRRFDDDDAVPTSVTFEEYFPELETWLEVRTVASGDELFVYLHDVTDRQRREDALNDREAELGRLARINAIIQEIIRELIGATTRAEVEQTVCERLAASDLYEFTWIGESEPLSDRITHRTAAGEYQGVVELLVEGDEATDTSEAPEPPEHVVARSGETRVVSQLVEDESVPEAIRRVAFARGLQSAIAVPVRYGTTTYGVLGVYATRPDAFTERERESLETLGVVTGFVINAARQRNLLLSDTVVELTFRLTDRDDPLVAASSRFTCSLVVEGIVPLDEGSVLCYVGVDGTAPEQVLAMVRDHPDVGSVRLVNETADDEPTAGGLVELTVTGASPIISLVERGATVRTAVFEEGVGRIVAEVAPDEDVRTVVEGLASVFPDSELLAKRERQRTVETAQEFRSSLHERLTERQQTALRVAYHGGYFQSPRDSTAEELAERLGISSPTLHYHLRAAQWKLVDAFLDDDRGQLHSDLSAEWTDDRTGDG